MTATSRVSPRFVLLLSFAAQSVLNYGYGVAMGWLLPPPAYGLLAFAQTVGLVAGLILHYGIPPSLTASIAGREGSEREALVRGSLMVNLVVAAAIAALLTALYGLGPLGPGLESWTVALIVVLSLPFVSVIAVAWGAAQGAHRFGVLALIQVVEIVCKVIVGGALVVAGYGVVGALLGLLAGAVLGSILGLVYLRRDLGIVFLGAIRFPPRRAAGLLFLSMLGLILLLNIDLVAVKLLSDEHSGLTGYYQAGTVLANAPYYLVNGALVPIMFTRLASTGRLQGSHLEVIEPVRTALLLVIPIEIALAFVPSQALAFFFPAAYAAGASALRLLALGNAMLILDVLLITAFQATANARFPAVILLGVTVLEAGALALVVPRGHLVGASSVFLAAASLDFLLLAGAYLRAAGVSIQAAAGRRWAARYLAGVLGAVAVGCALAAAGPGPYVGLAVGVLVYVAAATRLGLISRETLSDALRRSPA